MPPLASVAWGKREKQNHRNPLSNPSSEAPASAPRGFGAGLIYTHKQRASPGRRQTSAHQLGMAFLLPSGIFCSVGKC